MDLPDPFRLASDGKRQQDYCVINFNNEKSDVEMAVTAISTFNQALGDFLPTLGKSLARQYKWPDAPTWNRVSRKDRIEVAYSDLIPAGVDERGKPTNAMQLVAVAHNGAAQLLTLQYPGPADATAKYVEHVAKIAASVRNAARPK